MKNNSHPTPIDINKIDLDLMKIKTTDIPSLLEYAHNIGGFPIAPTNQGQIKCHAMNVMIEQTDDQLNLIFEQMKTLARQVQDIKKRVYLSELIYNAEIPFTPIVGKTYFLYQEESLKRYLSLISPEEWGVKISQTDFIAEVKLSSDHTWKVIRSTIKFASAE